MGPPGVMCGWSEGGRAVQSAAAAAAAVLLLCCCCCAAAAAAAVLLLLLLLFDVLNQFFEGRLAPEHARNGVWAASSCSTAPPLLARRSRKFFSRSCGRFFDAHDFSKKVLKLI